MEADSECKQAFHRYRRIRLQAYVEAKDQIAGLQRLSPEDLEMLSLQDINERALDAAEAWPYDERIGEYGGRWQWRFCCLKFSCYPQSLKVALWYGDTLCGLMLGKVSKGKLFLRLHLIQGNPEHNPLDGKIAAILLLTAEIYSEKAGISAVSIEEPVEKVMAHYRSYGYTPSTSPKGRRMVKTI